MRGRIAIAGIVAAGALAFGAAPAQADHHFMVLSEVYPGTIAQPNDSFIELQMYASGQGNVSGHVVKVYDAAGVEEFSFALPNDVTNEENNRTILIGEVFLSSVDFIATDLGGNIPREGGAACFISSTGFGPLDCVSWGSYAATPPSPTGTPVPGSIPDGSSLTRRVDVAGCPTFLESGDDTDDSAADFVVTATQTPSSNSAAVPTESCPNTTITRKPRKRTMKRRATFGFTATQGVADFQCKLDSAPFTDCLSPFSKRVKLGRHTFKVKAQGDSSPASYSWKVVKK